MSLRRDLLATNLAYELGYLDGKVLFFIEKENEGEWVTLAITEDEELAKEILQHYTEGWHEISPHIELRLQTMLLVDKATWDKFLKWTSG